SRAEWTGDGGAQRAPLPGLAGRLPAYRPAWNVQLLRSLHPYRRCDVQPACEVAGSHEPAALAPADRIVQLPAELTRMAAGPQRLHPPGPRFYRRGDEQEGRGGAGLPGPGHELPAFHRRSLPP